MFRHEDQQVQRPWGHSEPGICQEGIVCSSGRQELGNYCWTRVRAEGSETGMEYEGVRMTPWVLAKSAGMIRAATN